MNLYLKIRLHQEPFLVCKALTSAKSIDQWIRHQTIFSYSDLTGFSASDEKGLTFKADHQGDDKCIPCTLFIDSLQNDLQKTKKAQFELFYMRSHSQSEKFTDLHFMITDLEEAEYKRAKSFLGAFLEALRQHYNGNWIITDRDLLSSRLF